jgi:hypothetical protein
MIRRHTFAWMTFFDAAAVNKSRPPGTAKILWTFPSLRLDQLRAGGGEFGELVLIE